MARSGSPLGSLAALVAVLVVAMTGFGVFLPIFPFLALSTGASATAVTWALGAYSLGQFLTAPLWGRLSDRVGRKPVLLIGLLGSVASYLLLSRAETILEMGGARLLGGLMAGNVGAAFAAAADLADDRTRARNMGLLGAAVGFGFIAGPALGAFLIGPSPDRAGFARICEVAAMFATAAALVALLFFRETRRAADAPAERARAWSLLRAQPRLRGFVLIALTMMSAQALMEASFGLWARAAFDWGPHQVGWALAAMGLGAALLQGGGAGAATKRFGDAGALRGGLAAFAAGLLFLAAARNVAAASVALGFVTLGVALATPALQSLVAKSASEDARGAALGLNQSASALGRVLGPALAGLLFDTLGPAAPFACGAALLFCAFLLSAARPPALQPSSR